MPSHSTQARPLPTIPSSSTATQTQTTCPPRSSSTVNTLTLRLRAEPVESRRIKWAENVVDNEGLGRKKSKVCCIYHPPRAVGESSSEDDSSSDSDSSDSREGDNSRAKMRGKGKAKAHKHYDEDDKCCDHSKEGGDSNGKGKTRQVKNAYELVPKRGGSSTITEQPKT